jgi:hypothetical protein
MNRVEFNEWVEEQNKMWSEPYISDKLKTLKIEYQELIDGLSDIKYIEEFELRRKVLVIVNNVLTMVIKHKKVHGVKPTDFDTWFKPEIHNKLIWKKK